MTKRYGRSEMRQDLAWATARATDAAWAEKQDRLGAAATPPCTDWEDREADVRDDLLEVLTESVAQVAGRYLDPDCRYLRHPAHVCHDRDGQPLRQHASCWLEARLQILEQSAVIRAAEIALLVRP